MGGRLTLGDRVWEQASPPSLHSPPLLERQHGHNKQNKARLILGPFSGEGGGLQTCSWLVRCVTNCLLMRNLPFVFLIRLKNAAPPRPRPLSRYTTQQIQSHGDKQKTSSAYTTNTTGKHGLLLIPPPALALRLRLTNFARHRGDRSAP